MAARKHIHDGIPHEYEDYPADGMRFAIVVSRFNDFVTDELQRGCVDYLEAKSHRDPVKIEIFRVPGAFEIPLAAKKCAETGRFDAVICLGAVIEGETDHYRLVVDGAMQGILKAGLDTGIPVIFEVLATKTVELAVARAGGSAGNKGEEAAQAAIEMVRLLREIQ